MSMSVGGGDDDKPMMDMNTTPLIDVMLVMLIMFIITIPIQTHAVKIDLPVPDNSPADAVDPVKNKLVIDAQNTILWNGEAIDLTELERRLELTKTFPVEPELQVQPDPNARYLTFDRVMAAVKRSGVTKMGFVGNEQYARVF